MEKLEYIIPINPNEEELNEVNENLGTDFKTTEYHLDEAMDKYCDLIELVMSQHSLYIGDHIKITIQVEYCPENK